MDPIEYPGALRLTDDANGNWQSVGCRIMRDNPDLPKHLSQFWISSEVTMCNTLEIPAEFLFGFGWLDNQ